MRRFCFTSRRVLISLTVLLLQASAASAQNPPGWMGGGPASVPPPELKDVAIVEHTGSTIPLDLAFVDETGRAVKLGEYFTGRKPVLLQMGYFQCPMLCGLISQGLIDSVKAVTLLPGKDFEFVYVSIDPTEKPALAASKKAAYVGAYGKPETAAGFHLLTGTPESIAGLTRATGFGYKWVPSVGQYAHPAVVVLGMPDGKISRYLDGVRFDPQTLRLSLVEASDGKVGTATDTFLLTCFQYDGKQGKYAMTALTIMRTGGVLMILVVGGALTTMFRREWKLEAKRLADESGTERVVDGGKAGAESGSAVGGGGKGVQAAGLPGSRPTPGNH